MKKGGMSCASSNVYVTRSGGYHKLLKIVNATMPRFLNETHIDARSIEILGGGYSTSVCLKVKEKEKEYFIKFSKEGNVINEVYWHLQAENHKFKTPKIISYDLSESQFPFEYAIFEYIDGKIVSALSKRELYLAGYFSGKSLISIHKIKTEGFGFVDSEFKWKYRDWLSVLKDIRRKVDNRIALKIISDRELDNIDENTIYNEQLKVKDSRLLHGDLWEGNVLCDRNTNEFFHDRSTYNRWRSHV